MGKHDKVEEFTFHAFIACEVPGCGRPGMVSDKKKARRGDVVKFVGTGTCPNGHKLVKVSNHQV